MKSEQQLFSRLTDMTNTGKIYWRNTSRLTDNFDTFTVIIAGHTIEVVTDKTCFSCTFFVDSLFSKRVSLYPAAGFHSLLNSIMAQRAEIEKAFDEVC